MRVLISALASPAGSGGMRLHASEIVTNWADTFEDDRVTVVGPAWVGDLEFDRGSIKLITWPNENFALRVVGEMIIVPLVALFSRCDVILSLSPVVSPLVPRARTYSVAHDWRHLRRPHQFSRAQHLYRRLWARSTRWVRVIFAISEKTAAEVDAIPRSKSVVTVPNGGDHPRRWLKGTAPSSDPLRRLVTFGHKNHKRPDLVIKALALLDPSMSDVSVTVLGATGAYQDELKKLAEELAVGHRCLFPGFVADEEYQRTISGSSLVLLVCDDDGFGLPLSEATYFGIPSVVTTDSGLSEIHPSAIAADPTPPAIAAAITSALAQTNGGPEQKDIWTWNDCVASMRKNILCDQMNRAHSNPTVHTESTFEPGRRTRTVLVVPADRTTTTGYAISLGDAMLTDALVATLTEHGDRVTVADFGEAERVDGSRERMSGIASLVRACRSSDLVLIGGGTMLQDDDRDHIMAGLPRLCLVTALAARAARTPAIFVGVGVDPVDRRLPRLLLRCAVRLSERVYVRDGQSLSRLVENLHAGRRARLGADLALLLTAPRTDGQARSGAVYALNRRDAPALSVETIRSVNARFGMSVFLSMDQGPDGDWKYLRPNVLDTLDLEPGHQRDWKAALQLVASSEVVIASRLHALYLAALTRTPAIAVGSSPKVRAFAEEFNVPIVSTEMIGLASNPRMPDVRSLNEAAERSAAVIRLIATAPKRRGK